MRLSDDGRRPAVGRRGRTASDAARQPTGALAVVGTLSPRRTSPATRRSGGARAAGTTRSWPPSRASSPSSASRRTRSCSSPASGAAGRFVYYMNTYGIHSDPRAGPGHRHRPGHRRPELSVWIVTGDGDALSIGGNHLIHALRRNVNLKILMFNNQIYGLTKGQYSPTSEEGKVTKSTPFGSLDHPFNPVALALGAEATFVARTIDMDRQHLTEVLRAAAAPPRDGVRRDLPELQRVQRRRVRSRSPARRARARNQIRLAARQADHVRRERGAVRGGRVRRDAPHGRDRGHAGRARSTCTTRTTRSPAPAFAPGPPVARAPPAHRRSACSATSSGPCTAGHGPADRARHRAPGGRRPENLLHSGDTWTVG